MSVKYRIRLQVMFIILVIISKLYSKCIISMFPLTSGNTEMLLFSRFSSSSSRHLANDLGMADNLLYRRPKRFMLARLPTMTRQTYL